MRLILLFLLLFFTTNCFGATWNIYIRPGTKTSTQVSRQPIQRPYPIFFNEKDFIQAVSIIDEEVSKHANWNLKVVPTKSQADIEIASHNPLTWSPMYLGNKVHAAGMWWDRSYPRVVVIHDGWIPRSMSGSGYAGWWPFTKGNIRSLAALILHEIGHSNTLAGNSHRLDLGKLIHSDPQAEINLVRSVFGPPKAPPKPPEPPEPPQIKNVWHNEDLPADVNADLNVTPLDALIIINLFNRKGTQSIAIEDINQNSPPYYDVDNNRVINTADALKVINTLNRR